MDYKQRIKNLLINDKEKLKYTNKNKTSVSLVEILEEEMINFKYEDTNDITYIFDLFEVLGEMLDSKGLKQQLSTRFTYIHNVIRNHLHAEPNKEDKQQISRYRMLKNIINKMENTMLILYLDNPVDYDPNKEQFIHYIIFKQKYINFFIQACEKFPHLVNSVDENGKPLVELVLDKYLESLDIYLSKENLGPIDDLIYYDKVLRVMFENEKLNIDDANKKIMLEKLKKYAKTKQEKITSNRLKEKLSFFINNASNCIMGYEEPKSIEYLSYKYEIHDKFKEAHNLEAQTIYTKYKNLDGKITPRKIYTFDGKGAKELDDGLSIIYEDGIYHLGVHIADPGSYINNNSILMDEAKRRTTSLYMGDYCIPLYPFILSGDTMSLNVGKKTYCMSYYYDIDELTGELLKFEIKNELCEIAGNLTYDYFDKCMDKGTDDKELFETLIHLTDVSEILKRIYNEDFIYQTFHNDKNNSLSRSVVESAMIYTNYHTSKLFSDRDLPFIYRCHSINDMDINLLTSLQEKLSQKETTSAMTKEIEMMKNLFPRAFYTSTNSGHYGLGIDYYSHVTSPLRRLADNLANECIKKFILNEYKPDDKKIMLEKIDEISETINSKRNSAEDYEIQYMRLKYLNNKNKNIN